MTKVHGGLYDYKRILGILQWRCPIQIPLKKALEV